MEELIDKIRQLAHDTYFYRGQQKAGWAILPRIGRGYKSDWDTALPVERLSMGTFKRVSMPHLIHHPRTDFEWLALMQHHGCATRLLDVTRNPLVAIYFACQPFKDENTNEEADGEVVPINRMYRDEIEEETSPFTIGGNSIYRPPHISDRIVAQDSHFLCFAKPNVPLPESACARVIIPADEKDIILRQLVKLRVMDHTLFPGLQSIGETLNRQQATELGIDDHHHQLGGLPYLHSIRVPIRTL